MKILHINTLFTGGAGRAVIRLHAAMLQEGIDSRILFSKAGPDAYIDGIGICQKGKPLSLRRRIERRLIGDRSIEHAIGKRLAKLKGTYECISFPLSSYKVEEHAWIREADVIHLHWVANFINYPSFFRAIDKPIIWTLHDMNPFQGVFHYENDSVSNHAEFGSLDEEFADLKLRTLSHVNNLTVVTPTEWLGKHSRASDILGGLPHRQIANGVDIELFRPYNKAFARKVFNLPRDRTVLLFASERLDNKRKGLDLLLGAVENMQQIDDIAIYTVGKMDGKLDVNGLNPLGPISDDRLLALLYSAADAFILPSREDNLPNTMLEAMACGTPVIGFAVGGLQEVIRPGFNGLLAEDISSDSLMDCLMKFRVQSDNFDREKIREFAVERFSSHTQARAYLDLYHDVLSSSAI